MANIFRIGEWLATFDVYNSLLKWHLEAPAFFVTPLQKPSYDRELKGGMRHCN